jgi:2-(1,2-epoxy-1,2-dihydrophenyl)acetyl-CoA isomerase
MTQNTSESPILYKQEGSVVWITLNRPAVYNSFDGTMMSAFHQALDRAGQDDAVRCVIIQGAGKAFCAGQDLSEFLNSEGKLPALSTLAFDKIVEERYKPMILKIVHLQKPVIAAVNGVAAGAGANLALACDLVVASASANFIQAFSQIGLVPDAGGTYFLPKLVGKQRALAWMMLGDKISAATAKESGMIYDWVDDAQFSERVQALANRLAHLPTKALAYTKKLIHLASEHNLEDQLMAEGHYQQKSGQTEDFSEGVSAFLEKRTPKFKGN